LNKAVLPFLLIAALWAAENPGDAFAEKGLVGYRPWTNVRPWITATLKPEDRGLLVSLDFFCPGAAEMKVVAGPSFAEIPWRPFEPSVRWALPAGKTRIAIRAVFREKRPQGDSARVTPPVSRLLDLADPDRILTGDGEGVWMDWTDGVLHAGATARKRDEERHDAGESRKAATEAMRRGLGTAFLALAAEDGIDLSDLLGAVGRRAQVSLDVLERARIDEMDFPALDTVRVRGSVPLWGPAAESLREAARLLQVQEPALDAVSARESAGLLVLDARGLHFTPCLFPQVWAEDDTPCLVPGRRVSWQRPYVRYLRNPSQASLARLGGLVGLKGAPVFLKAIGTRPQAPSTLLLTRRNQELLRAAGAGLARWMDGGWVVLVD